MHFVRKKPRRLEPLLEMPKIQADMEENHQPDERDNNSRGGRETPRIHTGMGIPGNKKGRESSKALNRGHALMHMLAWKCIIIAHTKASIEGIPPKNINTDIILIWKQIGIMSRLITRIRMQYNTPERARIKKEAKQEVLEGGFSHYKTNTNKKIEPLAQINENLDLQPKIRTIGPHGAGRSPNISSKVQ